MWKKSGRKHSVQWWCNCCHHEFTQKFQGQDRAGGCTWGSLPPSAGAAGSALSEPLCSYCSNTHLPNANRLSFLHCSGNTEWSSVIFEQPVLLMEITGKLVSFPWSCFCRIVIEMVQPKIGVREEWRCVHLDGGMGVPDGRWPGMEG
jgi:hypothetical protein